MSSTPTRCVAFVRAGDRPDAEVVLVPDTALHTARSLETLEEAIGKPVLTANQVSVWEALRLAGRDDAARGRDSGTLFSRSLAGARR